MISTLLGQPSLDGGRIKLSKLFPELAHINLSR
jgi:hypothetical protein